MTGSFTSWVPQWVFHSQYPLVLPGKAQSNHSLMWGDVTSRDSGLPGISDLTRWPCEGGCSHCPFLRAYLANWQQQRDKLMSAQDGLSLVTSCLLASPAPSHCTAKPCLRLGSQWWPVCGFSLKPPSPQGRGGRVLKLFSRKPITESKCSQDTCNFCFHCPLSYAHKARERAFIGEVHQEICFSTFNCLHFFQATD